MKKKNPSRTWLITLFGRRRLHKSFALFEGTFEDALSEADVMECHVDWQVIQVSIIAK